MLFERRQRLAGPLMALALASSCGGSVEPGTGSHDAGVDAQQPLGATCDPSRSHPCLAGKDVCRIYYCDTDTHVCSVRYNDAGIGCGGNAAPDGAIDAASDAD